MIDSVKKDSTKRDAEENLVWCTRNKKKKRKTKSMESVNDIIDQGENRMPEPEDKVEGTEWSSKVSDKILTPSIPSGSSKT